MKDQKNRLLKNVRLKKLLQNIEDGVFSLDIDSMTKEIGEIHLTRKVRNMRTKDLISNPAKARLVIVSALKQNMAMRSRLVEIKETASLKKAYLEENTELVREYLLVHYSGWLKENYGSEAMKKSAVNTVLGPADRMYFRLETLENYATSIIGDMDQAYWSLKGIQEALTITAARERSI